MKVNELRIGNYVNYIGHETQITGTSIGYVSTLSSGSLNQGQVEPIPLTEEWLLKLGFKKTYSLNYEGQIGAMAIMARISSGKLYLEVPYGIYLGDTIQFVHDYQNLYFALMKRELEVKS